MHTDIQGQHSIWLPGAFLILQWMWELEWAKHILDFPPKECKNVKSNITILWDVQLEFRNWYVNVSYQTAMVRYNWKCISKLLHTDIQVQYYIWLPSAFLTLQWMWVLEWAKHILGCWAAWLWISPIKECKNVKSNITILRDVPLEFRNWYPFIRPESDHCIPLLVTIPTPVK